MTLAQCAAGPKRRAPSYAGAVIERNAVPVLIVDRVLLPGEHASLPVRARVLPPGIEPAADVAAFYSGALEFRSRPLETSVGVLAAVESLRPLGSDVVMVSLRSKSRVEASEISVSDTARVQMVEEGGEVTTELIAATSEALRRYLGTLAEYGEPVDVYPELPDDPILASYAVASLLDVSVGERQTLLEAGTAERRFVLLETTLNRERRLLEATMGAKGI